MPQTDIFLPMGALAFWTFFVLMLIPVRRFRAAFAGKVDPGDFKYGESARVPGEVSIPNRNYMNLLETPVLFYVICLMFYVTGRNDAPVTVLAWAFVILRVIHSLIHLTYNNVRHRLVFFALSNFAVIALWVVFFARLYG
ncbi:MAG: MAPEG family protein [Alphaproteobacteria bacterium]|nr:MAPEG family protein [Alphaproteobacteria bacterium]MDE2110697.1 MAPEG family protein [Alphaproteobacteria bacterium]MDE2494502.1 MAPEG family protein [Alphaproteobacteria bacterium]